MNVLNSSTSASAAIVTPPRKLCEWAVRPQRGPSWDGFTSSAIVPPLPPLHARADAPTPGTPHSVSTFRWATGSNCYEITDRPLRWAGVPTPDWVLRHGRVGGRLPRTHTESAGALFFCQPSGLILRGAGASRLWR